MNVLGVGSQPQSTSFNGAFARINGKMVDLLGGSGDAEKLAREAQMDANYVAIKIKNAFEPYTEKKLPEVDMFLSGSQAKNWITNNDYLSDEKKISSYSSIYIKPQNILETLLNGKIKIYGPDNISAKIIKNADAEKVAEYSKAFTENAATEPARSRTARFSKSA